MSGIKEETVSSFPLRIFRVVLKILRIKYIDEVRTTHGTSRMSGLRLFHH